MSIEQWRKFLRYQNAESLAALGLSGGSPSQGGNGPLKGDKGDKGDRGLPGKDGKPGKNLISSGTTAYVAVVVDGKTFWREQKHIYLMNNAIHVIANGDETAKNAYNKAAGLFIMQVRKNKENGDQAANLGVRIGAGSADTSLWTGHYYASSSGHAPLGHRTRGDRVTESSLHLEAQYGHIVRTTRPPGFELEPAAIPTGVPPAEGEEKVSDDDSTSAGDDKPSTGAATGQNNQTVRAEIPFGAGRLYANLAQPNYDIFTQRLIQFDVGFMRDLRIGVADEKFPPSSPWILVATFGVETVEYRESGTVNIRQVRWLHGPRGEAVYGNVLNGVGP